MISTTRIAALACVTALACKPSDLAFPKMIASCLHYDEIQQRFIHNAYGPVSDPVDEQLLDMMIVHRIRAFELDLQPSSTCPGGDVTPTPDWYIYHFCGDFKTNVTTLSDALRLIRAFHDLQPRHEVITLNLELGSNVPSKGGRPEFGTHAPATLDALLRSGLGPALYEPTELLRVRNKPTLAAAVAPDSEGARSGWPSTDALRGRVLVIIHGEQADVGRYFGTTIGEIQQHAAFLLDEYRWSQQTAAELREAAPYAVFHSEIPTKDRAGQLRRDLPGHVLRSVQIDDCNRKDCRGDVNRARVAEAQAVGMNMLYMNMGSAIDPAFRTVNEQLYPFGASVPRADGTFPVGDHVWQHLAVLGKHEPGSQLVVADASGGDIEQTQDKFTFEVLPGADGTDESWFAEIASTSNATVHPHGKGMIMARASTAPDAAYCAVGRTADRYGLRIQWRDRSGGGTSVIEQFGSYASNRPVDRENYHQVRLDLDRVDNGRSSRCRAWVSMDGRAWSRLGGDLVFANTLLSTIGVAASSNSGRNNDNQTTYAAAENRFIFVALRRRLTGSPAQPVDLAQFVMTNVGGTVPREQRLDEPEEGCAIPR